MNKCFLCYKQLLEHTWLDVNKYPGSKPTFLRDQTKLFINVKEPRELQRRLTSR